ncbi:MAG TPA: hypothetical protein VM871_00370, partial [Flavisolibacter sp.]|nr:hypothetical protein [Flavisolibacter sp.]
MKKKLLFIFLVSFCQLLQAQLLFTTLKPSDGLSSRETRCVYRDSSGYVWTGTNNGLNRFDGAHFKLWNKLSAGYPDGLGEMITSITEHGSGQIWFGTNAGIGVLDKVGNRIKEVKLNATNKGQKLAIGKLAHDSRGRLWATTNAGLLIEQGAAFVPVSQVYPFAKELDNLFYFQAAFAFDGSRNCFWIGTATGTYCLDLRKQKVFSVANNPDHLPFLSRDVVISLTLDDKNNLWFSNATATSLCHYNFDTKAFQQITQVNNNPAWWLNGGCNALFFDKQGRLWISTWLYNTFIRYPDGRFEEIPYDRYLPHSIGYGFFSEAFQDKYGNVWLATINGLSKLQAGRFVENILQAPSYKFYLPTGFANINCVQLDDAGNYWLGKMDGLVKYNVAAKTFERYAVSATELLRNEVFDIKYINGEVWCATSKGVQILNPRTKRFRTFAYDENKKNEGSVWWIMSTKAGAVWFSIGQHGVYRYQPRSGDLRHFTDSSLLNTNCAIESSDGRLWLGTSKEGLLIFDPATEQFLRPPPSVLTGTRITSMTEDDDKNIWISLIWKGLIKC